MTVADPKRVLHLALLLGVAKNLTWVFFSHHIKEFVFGTDLRVVLVSRVNKFLKDACFNVFLVFFFNAHILVFTAFAFFLANCFLITPKKFFGLIVINLVLSFVKF